LCWVEKRDYLMVEDWVDKRVVMKVACLVEKKDNDRAVWMVAP
jgi:hypothetical protein